MPGLSYYICGKPRRDEDRIRCLSTALDELGCYCVYDWTEHPLNKPFQPNDPDLIAAGRTMLTAASSADLIIAFLGPDLIGVYLELGAALGAELRDRYQRIILIGTETEVHRSVYFFAPCVARCLCVEETELIEFSFLVNRIFVYGIIDSWKQKPSTQ